MAATAATRGVLQWSRQFKVEAFRQDATRPAGPVFDRAVLAHHTMDDLALANEIMKLFLDQLTQLETADWPGLDLTFQMHTLRGAAAAVGATQLQYLADEWSDYGTHLEGNIEVRNHGLQASCSGLVGGDGLLQVILFLTA